MVYTAHPIWIFFALIHFYIIFGNKTVLLPGEDDEIGYIENSDTEVLKGSLFNRQKKIYKKRKYWKKYVRILTQNVKSY